MFKTGLIIAVAVVLGGWASSVSAETYTGCLTESGRIKKMQEGDKPRPRCDDDERQITLNSPGPEGPQGDKGDTGDAGPQGDKGDDGADGAPGTHTSGRSKEVLFMGINLLT